jgi:predicted dienelactone hydrolase
MNAVRLAAIAAAWLLGASASASARAQEAVSLTRQDGRPLAVTAYAPKQSPCRGLALVSPGAGGSEQGYRFLGDALSAQGYLAVVMGHPESGSQAIRARLRGSTLRDALADLITDPQAYRGRFLDIAAARRWARERCGSDEAVLVGHSMGAATAMIEAGARNRVDVRGADAFGAYVALSPQGAGSIFPEGAWSGIRRPVLLLTGTRDTELGGGSWETRTEPFRNLPAGCAWLGVIDGATHMNFAGHGASQSVEAVATRTIAAFLDALRRGECRSVGPIDGIDLTVK